MPTRFGTFNTISQGKAFEMGGDFPVWVNQQNLLLYPGGAQIDLEGEDYQPGDVIHAGTPVIYDGPGKKATIVKISDAENLKKVNGLVFNDVCIPVDCISASCAVAYSGIIYANRANGGDGLPESLKEQLPQIAFIYEDEPPV